MILDRVPGRLFRSLALLFWVSLAVALVLRPSIAASPESAAWPGQPAGSGRQARFVSPALPVGFIANGGQLDARVRYYGPGRGYGVYFTREEVLFGLAQRVAPGAPPEVSARGRAQPVAFGEAEPPTRYVTLALRFLGANAGVRVEARGEEPGKVNYLIGKDPAQWRTGLPTYREVVYRELWSGVDLVFGTEDGRLKSEFVLRPGARVGAIRLAYRGAERLAIDAAGNLVVRTPAGVLTEARPTSYQEIAGRRVPVEARFVLKGIKAREHVVGFVVGDDYDPNYPLIIDPTLAYSTYLGGAGTDRGFAIAFEDTKAYVTGATTSSSIAGAAGFKLFGTGGLGGGDVFVARLDFAADGSVSLGYLTFVGGSLSDSGWAIAVRSGKAHVTGETFSSNFPTTPGAFKRTIGGGGKTDAFLLKLNTVGSALEYSTYLGGGGPDRGLGVAVDGAGFAYVVGETLSSSFPITPNVAFAKSQGKKDAFVSKFEPFASPAFCPNTLCYSTYLGGNGDDVAHGVVVDSDGNAYVAGETASASFPVTVPGPTCTVCSLAAVTAYDSGFNGSVDGFVTKLNADASKLHYSTYLGGSGLDAAYAIALDGANNVYVTGETSSSGSFPTTAGAYDTSFNGGVDAFVAKLSPSGASLACPVTLCYSTYLGGTGIDRGWGIVVDSDGAAYIAGETTSPSFANSGITATFDPPRGGVDAFAAKLSANGSSLESTIFLGGATNDKAFGIALGGVDTAYLTGETASTNFPTKGTVVFSSSAVPDAFVAKLGFAVVNTKPTADPKTVAPAFEDTPVTFNVTATDAETTDSTKLKYNVNTTGLAGTLSGAGPAFTFTPSPNFFGTTTFTFTVTDPGAPDNCGPPYGTFCAAPLTSDPATVTINVAPVNDAPSFTAGPNQVVLEDAGAGAQVVVPGWASSISAGAANEDQTLTFVVTTDNAALFAVQPAIDPAGNLTYTLALNANGVAHVTVKLQDSGATGHCDTGGDCNTSVEQTFTITANAVNDPPFFAAIADQTVVEPVDIQITGVSPGGGADEAGQTVTLTATSSDPTLVTNLVITGTGPTRTLRYERPVITQDQAGSVTITVTADDGQAVNGPSPQQFTLTLGRDNCPGVSNPDQSDLDHDGVGDLCDPTPVPGLAADQVNAGLTGFASGSVKVTVTVTYTPRADGQCYLAHPASQATLAVRGADVNQTPESGPIVYSADGLLTVCLTPVTSSAEIDLTQWVTSPSGAVDINYVTIGRKDPELGPDGTCPSGSCFESIFQGDVPAGSVSFTVGNQVAIKSFVTMHTTDLGQGPSTKVAAAPAVRVKVFDRDSPAFRAFDGSNPAASFFGDIYESNAGLVSDCVTDLSGNCLASVSMPDSYFVILKFVDTEHGKLVYEGSPVGAGNFDLTTGLATKAFQIQKVLNNGEFVEYHADSKTLIVDCGGTCQ